MKNLLLILSVVLISASLSAQSSVSEYIKTNEGTFFFKKIKTGNSNNFIGLKKNGERVKFNKEDVISYVQKGKYFQKMPVYVDNVLTGEKDFMKLVEKKKELVLLEYKHVSTATGKKATKFYVFKNNKLVVEMNENNKETLSAYFGTY